MLRFAEEIILILLDDEDGRFVRIPRWSLNYALAGGILMDLAMENRIDTDLENLILVDSSPVGDSLLDPALAEIAASEQKDTRYWLEHLAEKGPEVREEALNRLVNEGILERQDDRFMWMFRSPALPDGGRAGRTGSEAPDHGGAVQRDDTRAPGHNDHLPGGRVRDLPGAAVQAAVRTGGGAYRIGEEAGHNRAGDVPGDQGHRADGDILDAAAPVLGQRNKKGKENGRPA